MFSPELPHRQKNQVLLVEDHPMIRERLAQLVNQDANMEVCGEATDAAAAVAFIKTRHPDIALLDLGLRGSTGFDVLKQLEEDKVTVPVLVVSMHEESTYAERALRAGARGYVSKTEPSSEVMRAIRKVLNGEVYLNERMTSDMIQRMSGQTPESRDAAIETLAARELKVFQLLGQGKNTHEIARRLGLGESTIATLRVRIKEKIGAKDVAELYHRATEWMKDTASV